MFTNKHAFSVCAAFIVAGLSYSNGADASLLARDLDGNASTTEAYFDADSNISWLADANAGAGSIYDNGLAIIPGSYTDGLMTWENANAWATSLNINGISGWRLPSTLFSDSSCDTLQGGGLSTTLSTGYYCSGSEMGHLFYTELGGSAGNTILGSSDPNLPKFKNIISSGYWSTTQYPSFNGLEYFIFDFNDGSTSSSPAITEKYAWAVHPGDVGVSVSIVPIPGAIWLFGSALFGLIGVARHKKVA